MISKDKLIIRPYRRQDQQAVIDLWTVCGLIISSNNPEKDIARKLKVNPEYFLIAALKDALVATCMAGYEGHRGWINYLAVSPAYRRQGIATKIIQAAEDKLKAAGCPKINLQIRASNRAVRAFYHRIGFSDDHVLSMGKRLQDDPPYDGNRDI